MGRDCQTSINSSCNFICIFPKYSQSQVILLPRRQNYFLWGKKPFLYKAQIYIQHINRYATYLWW